MASSHHLLAWGLQESGRQSLSDAEGVHGGHEGGRNFLRVLQTAVVPAHAQDGQGQRGRHTKRQTATSNRNASISHLA